MKNFTSLLFAMLMATFGMAQTISFETSENYNLGNIGTQTTSPALDGGTWTVSLGGGTTPITNQIVSAERASDGSNSLKLVPESFDPQPEANTGAFYAYPVAIDVTSAIFEFDIYIDASGLMEADISDHIIGFRNGNTNITVVNFAFSGGVGLLTNTQADGNGDVDFEFGRDGSNNFIDWNSGQWYNVRVEINNPNVELFIDGNSVLTAFVATPNLNITEASFVHNNYDSSFFIDSFETNDEVLSVDEELVANEDYRYLSNSKELLLKNSGASLESLNVFNMLGQQVMSQTLAGNEERINVQNLSTGIYIAQITVGGSTQTLKFSKH